MERLTQALQEALERNSEETQKWKKYQDENRQAVLNLEMFRKKLEIDIMVPIGSKAFMPGYIYHTNEVFVSHYIGILSKCSSSQAQEVCNHRLKTAKERLECLEKERDMYQNRLKRPYADGALPSENEREIIEEYDEEVEEKWREEHRRKVRQQKQREREAREQNDEASKSDDIFRQLEDLELMEELEKEMENYEITDDDTLQKIVSGEIQVPPEKIRISHSNSAPTRIDDVVVGSTDSTKQNNSDICDESKKGYSKVEEIIGKYKNISINDDTNFTNNNSITNINDFDLSSDQFRDHRIQEIVQIEKEISGLTNEEKMEYFMTELKTLNEEIKGISATTMEELNRKLYRIEIQDFIKDSIEILKDKMSLAEESINFQENNDANDDESPKKRKGKKRISFAEEDDIQFIDGDAPVIAVYNLLDATLDKTTNSVERIHPQQRRQTTEEDTVENKTRTILDKVEDNYQHVLATQSQQDFDLVGKIISANQRNCKTLSIEFDHSDNVFSNKTADQSKNPTEPVIGSPADIYRVFAHCIPPSIQNLDLNSTTLKYGVNTQENVHHFNINNNNDNNNNNNNNDQDNKLLTDPTTITNKKQDISNSNKNNPPSTKSILRNKNMVEKETHLIENSKKAEKYEKKKESKQADKRVISILGDVIEHLPTEPDKLPEGKFIDTSAPKKRISRFKQLRQNVS